MNGIRITSLRFYLVDKQTTQFRSSFQLSSDYDQDVVEDILRATDGGMSSSNASLSSVAKNMLGYQSAGLRDEALISNGWDQVRYRWQLHLVHRTPTQENEYIFSGWTDHDGIHVQGTRGISIDDNMIMYVNNVQHVAHQLGRNGRRTSISNDQIMYNDDKVVDAIGLRPSDNMNRLKTAKILGELASGNGHARADNTDFSIDRILGNDTNITFRKPGKDTLNSAIQANSRENNSITSYLNVQIQELVNAHVSQEMNNDDYNILKGNLYEQAENRFSDNEDMLKNNVALMQLSQVSDIVSNGCFTFKQLSQIDRENALSAQGVIDYREPDYSGFRVSEISNGDWRNDRLETFIAATIRDSLPSIMMSSWITHVHFAATNMEFGCPKPQLFPIPIDARRSSIAMDRHAEAPPLATTYPHVNYENSWRNIEHRFLTEIMPILTKNNSIEMELDIDMNIDGEFIIDITLADYNERVTYSASMFCDRLVQPTITSESNTAKEITRAVRNISDTISNERLRQIDQYGLRDRDSSRSSFGASRDRNTNGGIL